MWLSDCVPWLQTFRFHEAKKTWKFFEWSEGESVNNDVLKGEWKQIRGEAKAWWGKLTDDDLERAAGKFDILET